jgi:tRNA pseudouridine13 synthase
LFVPKIDRLIGLEVYATKAHGIGGVIRDSAEDFLVEEILVDGSRASIDETSLRQALSSSPLKNRYLLCILIKRNWDNFIAIKRIAEQLAIDSKQVSIAGIKDTKAVTAQFITVENASMKDIEKIDVKDMRIRPIGYLRNKLSAYYLLGNTFHIKIKAVNYSKSSIKKRISKITEELETVGGLPNFFGYQRFGTTRPITHLVGRAIVKGDFEKAAMLFLAKPSSHEHPASRQARETLQETQNYKQALRSFPKQLRYERLMLRHLVKKPDDFSGAFKRVPIKLQELFLQAYQSYLFNKFLSKRITTGLSLNEAELGDYVVKIEHSGLPMLTMHKIVTSKDHAEINNSIKAGKMRVAIPLIGFRQPFSQGAQGEIEKQILEEEEGIKPENFKIAAMPEMSERGRLRTIITPLKDFLLQEISRESKVPRKHQIQASFTLLRGSYATTLLREIMKPRNPIKAGF